MINASIPTDFTQRRPAHSLCKQGFHAVININNHSIVY